MMQARQVGWNLWCARPGCRRAIALARLEFTRTGGPKGVKFVGGRWVQDGERDGAPLFRALRTVGVVAGNPNVARRQAVTSLVDCIVECPACKAVQEIRLTARTPSR